ncbi:hypothetical protein Moror_1441 [Moniliophthora roreri MCA 2997]|uniref:Uncharacterized protein n=1 Tax=Moniliophthora roreri (strain MCA 2997) TaxID=1381753 RepID=V2X3P6_MONRO|nr:hypothetical protein Moror_1441 [Moniliophthora roreri MCA 2997]
MASTYSSILSVQTVIIAPATTFGLTLFVAGFYALLFGLSTYFLCKRRNIFQKKLQLAWTTTVFFISNLGAIARASSYIIDATVVYQAVQTQDFGPLNAYTSNGSSQTIIIALTYVCYILANCIADAILIHRCYVLYTSRKAVLFPLVFISFATNSVIATGMKLKGQTSGLRQSANWDIFVHGYELQIGYYCANAAVNGMLTLILAGRIWWLGRESRATQFQAQAIDQRYQFFATVIVESGMLYPMTLVAHVVLTQKVDTIGVPIDLTPIAILMAGIAPTLINVRISIGRSVGTTDYGDTARDTDSGQYPMSFKMSSQLESIRTEDLERQEHRYSQVNICRFFSES